MDKPLVTESDLQRITAYCAKATPGPWSDEYIKRLCRPGTYEFEITDLQYCVSARNDLPDLVEYTRELRRVLGILAAPGFNASAVYDATVEARRLLGEEQS